MARKTAAEKAAEKEATEAAAAADTDETTDDAELEVVDDSERINFALFPDTRRGNTGASILQAGLFALGFGTEVDGVFGRESSRALANFQDSEGHDATGVPTPDAWDAVLGKVRELVVTIADTPTPDPEDEPDE